MNPQVDVVLGPARAGKTHDLLRRYLAALHETPVTDVGRCLWIAPTARVATSIRDALSTHGDAFLSPRITTFDALARDIVFASNRRIRPVSRAAQRELLRRIVRQVLDANQLQFFADAARRTGFIDLLIEYIRELRQRDVSPDVCQRVAATRGQSAERRELSFLYAEYDRELTQHNLCDPDTLQWIARDALNADSCGQFAKLSFIVVDGFTDFTRMESELLRLLASRADTLRVSLPMDYASSDGRNDPFAKTAATLAELKQRFPKLKEQRLASRSSANAALDHITQHVFQYPHAEPTAAAIESLSSVQIIEAASAQDEITQLARRIKQLLTPLPDREGLSEPSPFGRGQGEGALPIGATPSPQPSPTGRGSSPQDILVIFRSLTDVASRIEETFAHHGIPFSLDWRPRIASSPWFQTLLSLLQLDADLWPFRSVISVITNNTLSAITEPARRAADWLIRDLQIASGRDALLESISRLAAQTAESTDRSEHFLRRIETATATLPALQFLAESFAQLPTDATPNEWTTALEAFALRLGLAPATDSADLATWQSVVAHLAAIELLDQSLQQPVRKLNRNDLLALLTDIGNHEPLAAQHDEPGAVRIVAAQSARNLSARHVFLAGMSEQSFPAATGAARLADDSEYRFLTNAAHQVESPAQNAPASAGRSQDEMLLFYEVVSRATESLTISYPAMDDKAQELPPSPYVVELQRMFRNSEKQITTTKPQLSPVPSKDSISSVRDWRIAALAEASKTDGDRKLFAGLFAEPKTTALAQAIDAGVRITHARGRGETFGPAEGVLTTSAVRNRLSKRFGKDHSWSSSQLETYASCPYKFFLEDVLGLEPLGDLTLETDFARRGSLLHHVLATFHRKFGDSASEWSSLSHDEPRFTAEIKIALQAAIEALPREGIEAALLELDRRQIDKWTDRYREQQEKYDGAWQKLENCNEALRPTHFELRFGRKHPGEKGYEDPASIDQTFPLIIGSETVNIVGRIDRIDVGRIGRQTVFNVIDYKSGARPSLRREKIESGERLQPALYVMAAQALFFNNESATPLWSGYWSMQSGVTTRKDFSLHCSIDGNPSDDWTSLQKKVIERVGEIVHATRRGDFSIDSRDPNCTSFCDFKTICRIAQARTTNKIPPPVES